MVLSRYCAVFPLANVLNAVSQWRATRRERTVGLPSIPLQLPREYQVMLFWAGLRGAVGFALSAGIDGENAAALQTTVLVVVVLTVIVFGGTTAQMLDILHIETGVQDDEELDEHMLDPEALPARLDAHGPLYRDSGTPGPSVTSGIELEESDIHVWGNALRHAVVAGPGGLQSVSPEELDEADDEHGSPQRMRHIFNEANLIFQNGQWFQRIDERYLLPMFSNAVASRKHEQQRRTLRQARQAQQDGDETEETVYDAIEPDAVADEPLKKTH